MSRFLTPSKIGLLALIELYTDADAPAASTIPILSFVLDRLLPHPRPLPASADLPYMLDISAFQELLSAHPSASGIPGRTLWDHLLQKLWDIDSLDALHAFFVRRRHLLAKTREEARRDDELGIPPPPPDMILLSRTSPLGSFIRRTLVEFERLRFNDVTGLWIAVKQWRGQTLTCWARRNGGLSRWAGDEPLMNAHLEWGLPNTQMLELVAYGGLESSKTADGTVSTDDVEKLLEFQVAQMQSGFLEPCN